MKKSMESKLVNKFIMLFYLLLGFNNAINSQEAKYLLFNSDKDKIVVDIDKTLYYKIDKNLFEITRYNQIDTVCKNKNSKINYSTVNQLWKESRSLVDSIIKKGIKSKTMKIIETNNQLFDKIYVLEKLTENEYKRTRVWWVDY